MARPSCRKSIVEAAERIVVEDGAARLTIDAVAERSGVSKGGVLYHFPSKEALLEGMLSEHLERSDRQRALLLNSIEPGPARHLLGEVQWLIGPREKDEQVRAAALLAVVANQPELMKSIRQRQRQRFDEITSRPGSFAQIAVVLLAADGLFLMELLQASPFTTAEREMLVTELLRLAEEVTKECSP